MRRIGILAWAALLPCGATAQAPLASVAPLATVDAYRGQPLAQGYWTVRLAAGSSEASYGVAGSPARLTLRCDLAVRRVRISRPDRPAGAITIITSSQTRTLVAPGEVVAFDPLLDAIAFSRGRFVVMTPASSAAVAGDVVIIPAWPEAARIAEDCRK
jgi:hypothetical protein